MTYWIEVKKGKWPSKMEWFQQYLKKVGKAEKKKLIVRKKGASLDQIRKKIDEKKPVIAEFHSNTFYGAKLFPERETHDVVVTGYDANHFFVNDPYAPYLGKKGKNVKIPVTLFKKARETFPIYQKVMIEIKKIK